MGDLWKFHRALLILDRLAVLILVGDNPKTTTQRSMRGLTQRGQDGAKNSQYCVMSQQQAAPNCNSSPHEETRAGGSDHPQVRWT